MTKILLVEDDKSLREIYGVRLLAEGYDIVSAGDGEEALAMAIKEKPTLIISDVMMPKISGFDMLDILRSTTETRDIKVIMMTALSSDDQRARGEQLGADRYLVKSQVGIEDVVRTVHEVLSDSSTVSTPAPSTSTASATPPAQSHDNIDSTPTSSVASASSPGNDAAGPLPPQPSESTLPQPTAPFSSPAPANLGERIIQPLSNATVATPAVTPEETEQISKELKASAEPVISTQVDEAIADVDVDVPAGTPAIESAPVAPSVISPISPTSTPEERPVISGSNGPIS
ncbi:MAG: response regulator [Candidatus Saccharimonadales bacterium]